MLPHLTKRGRAAVSKLFVYEGIPPPYNKKKRMVVPSALRVIRLKPNRRVSFFQTEVLILYSPDNLISRKQDIRQTVIENDGNHR